MNALLAGWKIPSLIVANLTPRSTLLITPHGGAFLQCFVLKSIHHSCYYWLCFSIVLRSGSCGLSRFVFDNQGFISSVRKDRLTG